jgi:hypothetical protein
MMRMTITAVVDGHIVMIGDSFDYGPKVTAVL